MGAITDSLDEQTVSASAAANDPIVYPTELRHPNEKVWLDILADSAETIRLVETEGATQGVPIASGSGSVTKGPYRLQDILDGRGPQFIHSTNPVSIPVVVSRDG